MGDFCLKIPPFPVITCRDIPIFLSDVDSTAQFRALDPPLNTPQIYPEKAMPASSIPSL